MDGADDDGDHDDLDAQKQTGQARLSGDEAFVEPGRRQHQDEPGHHEAQTREKAADPAARHHAHVDT
ncbi:hypothetical protein D3C80_1877920 [compost metagenome]